jgi:hypothetical protein
MKTIRLDLLLKKFPSGVLALFTLIASTIITFGIGEPLEHFGEAVYIAYGLSGLVIAICCFFIIRVNPKSIFYVPIISNTLFIISSIVEPNFWRTPMWIPICGGWVLTLIVSTVAAIIGKRDVSIKKY